MDNNMENKFIFMKMVIYGVKNIITEYTEKVKN